MTSGCRFSPQRRVSDASDEVYSAEAFEIAIEMSSGEPLHFSNRTLVEQRILTEYAVICREPVDGLYVTPSKEDLKLWFGVLFIRRGVYMGAILRFNLVLPLDFGSSSELPKVIFDLNVYHPHIDPSTKQFDIIRYFVDGWKPERHHLYHVLLVLQRAFFCYDADASVCRNPEAARMLQDNREGFLAKAREVIRESRSAVYDALPTSDAHAIRFFPWDASVHEPLRQRLTVSLAESQISTSPLFTSTSGSPTSGIYGSRAKTGFSWVSPSEGFLMTEQPRPTETELPKAPGCGLTISDGIPPCEFVEKDDSNRAQCCDPRSCKYTYNDASPEKYALNGEWDDSERASL